MGYILGDKSAPTYLVTSVFNISTGQILSSFMILGGAILLFFGWRAAKMKAEGGAGPEKAISRNAQARAPRSAASEARRLRKRIK
jgi:threonine/homoserine/homoserine lactone efflux protein